jgi:hypothetical protein
MNIEKTGALAPILTPNGRLILAPDQDAPILAEPIRVKLVEAFTRNMGHGLPDVAHNMMDSISLMLKEES